MPDFKNHRAQNPRYLKPSKKGSKIDAEKSSFLEVESGNRKPKTGDQKKKLGLRFTSEKPLVSSLEPSSRSGEYAPIFLLPKQAIPNLKSGKLGPRGFEPLTYGCLRPLY